MIHTDFLNTYSERKQSKRVSVEVSKVISDAKKSGAKFSDTCLICGKKVSSFCSSHTLPKFILKNLSSKGTILTGHSLTSNGRNKTTGVNNSLKFQCICDECDNTYFQDYEHEEILKEKLNIRAINEIAIKSHLRYLYKQRECLRIFKHLDETSRHKRPDEDYFYKNQQLLCSLNIKDTEQKIKYLIKHKDLKNFYVIDEFNLDYPVKIAYQGFISLVTGFDGLINNVYDYDPKNKIYQLGVCVLPYSTGTKVLLFCEDGAPRMKYFYKTYSKLSLEEKLYVINYIILLYDEDFAIDGNFDIKRLNKETKILINQTDLFGHYESIAEMNPEESADVPIKLMKSGYELKTNGTIYNFLLDPNFSN